MSSTPGDWSAMALPSGARSGYREGSMDSLPFTGAGRSTTRAGSTHRRQPGTNAPPPTAAPETARVLSKNPLLEVATLPLPRHGKVRIEDHLVLHPDEHQRGTLHPEGIEADRERARDAQMIRVSEGQGCVDGLLLLDPVEGEQAVQRHLQRGGELLRKRKSAGDALELDLLRHVRRARLGRRLGLFLARLLLGPL